jgi:adenylate cyclase
MKQFILKLLRSNPVKITLLAILLMIILFFIDAAFLRFMELKTLDLRMLSRGTILSGGETIIAAIDEKSIAELGRWPWPRTTMAKLVDTLNEAGAKAIGFDIFFSEADNNSSLKTISELNREFKDNGIANGEVFNLLEKQRAKADTDAVLAKAMTQANSVTAGYFFYFSGDDVGHLKEKEIVFNADSIKNGRYQLINLSSQDADDSNLIHAYAPEANIRTLSEAAVNCGYVNKFPDSDGTMRWSPLVIKFRNNYYSSLAISMLQQYLGWPMTTLNLAGYGVENVKVGNVTIPTDESGRLLINYLGPANTFPHYSVADILNGTVPAEKMRNKIVLVGATAKGIYDLRVTPFGSTYPGVEIHATVIDNVLHNKFLKYSSVTRFIDLCTIIICGLLMGLIIPRLRAVYALIYAILIICAFIVANIIIFSFFNIWLNLIYPVLTMLLIYLGITVYRYMTEEREKKKIRGAFQYYLTASVINEMLKDPSKLKLGGDKKNLSVLFSDIRGFTTISEKLSPEELVRLLNEYLTAMTNIVFKYGGLLDKYVGDMVMAVFGAPLDQSDHAKRACLTALDMMSKLRLLQKKWQDEGRPVINIGIGINSGDMVVGNMGSEMRFDYTVMGDMVNLGSRLEGTNKEYGSNIIISEFTYAAVKDDMCCRELDWVRVKGKKQPVRIYELLAEKKDENNWNDLITAFAAALALYREARWDEAIAAFQKVLVIRPEDEVSKIYVERCKNLKEQPLAQPWDGVFTMTRK